MDSGSFRAGSVAWRLSRSAGLYEEILRRYVAIAKRYATMRMPTHQARAILITFGLERMLERNRDASRPQESSS